MQCVEGRGGAGSIQNTWRTPLAAVCPARHGCLVRFDQGNSSVPTTPPTTTRAYPITCGISSSALADRRDSSRLLIWPPVLAACSSPSHAAHAVLSLLPASAAPAAAPAEPGAGGAHVRMERWYSGRSWSILMGMVVRTCTRRRLGSYRRWVPSDASMWGGMLMGWREAKRVCGEP